MGDTAKEKAVSGEDHPWTVDDDDQPGERLPCTRRLFRLLNLDDPCWSRRTPTFSVLAPANQDVDCLLGKLDDHGRFPEIGERNDPCCILASKGDDTESKAEGMLDFLLAVATVPVGTANWKRERFWSGRLLTGEFGMPEGLETEAKVTPSIAKFESQPGLKSAMLSRIIGVLSILPIAAVPVGCIPWKLDAKPIFSASI